MSHSRDLPSPEETLGLVRCTRLLSIGAVLGQVDARVLAVAKGLLQVFSILVNHRLSREEKVGGPIFLASTWHPYS